MKAALAAILLLSSLAARAEVTLLSGFVSKHSSGDYNERNHGIGIRIDSGKYAGWAVGTYRNSLHRQSVYLAREFTRHVTGPLHIGIIGVAATGYKFPVLPAALPEVVLRFNRFEVALVVQPIPLKQAPALIALQARVRF